MGRLDFTPFASMYRGHLDDPLDGIPKSVSMEAFYDQVSEASKRVYQEAVDRGQFETQRAQYMLESDIYQSGLEHKWHAMGAPAYRIWPEMLESVLRTTLAIDALLFEMPFPTFTVQFPRKTLRQDADSPYVTSMMVSTVHDPGGEGTSLDSGVPVKKYVKPGRKLVIISMYETGRLASGIMTKFGLYPGQTIEESFGEFEVGDPGDDDYWASKEMTQKLVTIAVSTALIGIGANPLLLKEAKRTTKDKLRAGRWARKKGVSAIGDPRLGFAVGSDIRLPKRGEASSRGREGEGRQLSWGHLRTGHLRRTRFKGDDGEWRYKIDFIPMTRVRPDLELKPKATDRSIRA